MSYFRGGALLLSFGTGYPELNYIISELKNLRSHTKAVRDSQQAVLQDMMNWACNDENRALQELFAHLTDLNSLWCEVQTQFAGNCQGEEKFVELLYYAGFVIVQFYLILNSESYRRNKLIYI